jgi:hypothetical protein
MRAVVLAIFEDRIMCPSVLSAFGGGARWVSSVVFLVGVWWWDGVVLRGIGIPTTRDMMCDCGSSERSAPEFGGF